MAEASIFLLKLLLASAAFVFVGWFGARDKRVGGLLLTFPLLNGIAMLTGVDPIGIAETIFVIVIWNCAFFFLLVYCFESLPPLPAHVGAESRIFVRAFVWVILWASGATVLTWFRGALPGALGLFVFSVLLAGLAAAWWWWRPPTPPAVPAFAGMWLNRRGTVRIACFVASFLVLSVVAYYWQSARWVGLASALPLPGIFALAMLSATQGKDDLISLGDTVLMGPLLVIPFNWLLARAIVWLRAGEAGTLAEIATVVLFWLVAGAIVFALVPAFARWRDGLRRV